MSRNTMAPADRRAFTTLTLGLAQGIAAYSWGGNTVGVLVGATTFAIGAALYAREAAAQQRTLRPRNAPLSRAARYLSAFAVVLLLVRAASPDRDVKSFPASCPSGLQGRHGCSRVAEERPHRTPPPPLDAPYRARVLLADVEKAVLAWASASGGSRATVLRHVKPSSSGAGGVGFLHMRWTTRVMGFADDVFLRYSCSRGGSAVVETQGQLRLGVGDMGVNVRRNADLLRFLRDDAKLPAAAWCR
jgi:hypothetical protein